jgi:hypothetical protein
MEAVRDCRKVEAFPTWFEKCMCGLFLGVRGDVTLVMDSGNWVTLVGLAGGVWHPVRFQAILWVSNSIIDKTFAGCSLP